MPTAEFLKSVYDSGHDYASYLATGTAEQQRRWTGVYELAAPTDAETHLITSFTRSMHVLIVSGIWCGDCVQQVPLIARLAEANPLRVGVRIVDRDARKDLAEQVTINGGMRVPAVLLLSEDFEQCALLGDRTISRYRALAKRQLGASCETGIAPPDGQEIVATRSDWCTELERAQLMLRLSPKLRERHND